MRRIMAGRDPGEEHRASTPLELLFDLCFVVAVAQAATGLHHALAEGHVGAGLTGYFSVFFAIWWAWMNFTWFASAYDTDDVPYRLLTLLQMGGVLVLAAGVPAAMAQFDFTTVTIGYVIMRVAMISQWLRAAAEHPDGRPAALRYAAGIAVLQIGWVARLWAPGPWADITFVILVAAELAVPAWSEVRGKATNWHPAHVAERYGLFTIIVLGEVILATMTGVAASMSEGGVSTSMLLTTAGGLVLVFSLWWIYFTGSEAGLGTLRVALSWGYGHYLVFASVAALGAGLQVVLATAQHESHLWPQAAALTVAVPAVLYLLVMTVLHRLARTGAIGHPVRMFAGAVVVLAMAFSTPLLGLGGATLGMGLALAGTLAANLVNVHRKQESSH